MKESAPRFKLPKGFHFGSEPFPNCALVSTGASLLHKGLGSKIDTHYPVIRVNRLPTRKFYSDFGTRTDALFANRWESRSGKVTLMGRPGKGCKHLSKPMCFKSQRCSRGGNGCPTLAVIMRTPGFHVWYDSPVPIAGMSKQLSKAAHALRFRVGAPSSGFFAFLAFLPACSKMTLYGFSGNASADGHAMNHKHHYESEHELYKLAGQGKLTEKDFKDWPSVPSGKEARKRKWMLEALNFRQVEVV